MNIHQCKCDSTLRDGEKRIETHQDMFDAAGIQVDTIMPTLKAPFPWFGGKSRVAGIVWERFGDVSNYVEPFFGSGAVLLGRPGGFGGPETVNDMDGLLANFWRAVSQAPDEVARWADWPVNEADLHARHIWIVKRLENHQARMMADPEYFDARMAGYWVYGICSWIGSGFASGKGPWKVGQDDEGVDILVDSRKVPSDGQGINMKMPHLGNSGKGINRKMPHLGDAGRGINRKRPHLGDAGQGINRLTIDIYDWFNELSARLRSVRVCCGDWSRVVGASPTTKLGITAVFLDPPYADTANRDKDIYACDSLSVAHEVREWAIANGDNPKLRIALCGYDGEHKMPDSWEVVEWKTKGGYGMQGDGKGRENQSKERIWFSPHCLFPLTPSSHGVSY